MRNRTSKLPLILIAVALVAFGAQSAFATHCVAQPPANLDQVNGDSSPLGPGDTTVDDTVILSGDVQATCDQGQQTMLDVELRDIGTAFNGTPTDSSASSSGTPGNRTVAIAGLTPGETYHWQARTNDTTYGSISAFGQFNGGNAAFIVFDPAGGGGGAPGAGPVSLVVTVLLILGGSLVFLGRKSA